MNLNRTFYKLPISNIPFGEIPSLKSIKYDHVLCSAIPIVNFMELDYCLISVYDVFDDQFGSIYDLTKEKLLFGEVLSEQLPIRGKHKCIKIGTQLETVVVSELPDLKYSPDNIYANDGRWFHVKGGNYFILRSVRSRFDDVKHLEGIALYGENILRLRLVIEMLKRNVKAGVLDLTVNDYKEIAYRVLKSDPVMARSETSLLKNGVDNWMPSMLMTPLYDDIPLAIRGRVLDR